MNKEDLWKALKTPPLPIRNCSNCVHRDRTEKNSPDWGDHSSVCSLQCTTHEQSVKRCSSKWSQKTGSSWEWDSDVK